MKLDQYKLIFTLLKFPIIGSSNILTLHHSIVAPGDFLYSVQEKNCKYTFQQETIGGK